MNAVLEPAQDLDLPRLRDYRGINHIVFSPDGERVALADVRMQVTVRQAERELFAHRLRPANVKSKRAGRVRAMAFGSSGDRLFVAAGDTVCAFDAWSGSELWRTVAPKAFGFMIVSPMALAASQRGELAVAFDNGTIGIYSETGELRRRWKDNDLPVSLAFLDCGEVVGADPFAICKWDTQTGSRVRRGVRDRIFAMAAHPSGWAVTRSWHEATVWNVPEDTVVATVPVRPGLPLVAMSPRGRRLALGAEHAVQIYSVDGQYLSEFDFPELRVTSIAFTPTGSRLAVGDSDGELRFVDLSPL